MIDWASRGYYPVRPGGRLPGTHTQVDEANAIDHMLNRGNRREPWFHTTVAFEAFERLMVEAGERSHIKLFAYCLLLNDFQRPALWRPDLDYDNGSTSRA